MEHVVDEKLTAGGLLYGDFKDTGNISIIQFEVKVILPPTLDTHLTLSLGQGGVLITHRARPFRTVRFLLVLLHIAQCFSSLSSSGCWSCT